MTNEEIIISELKELRQDVTAIRADIAVTKTDLEVFKSKVHFGAKMITAVGGGVTTAASALVSYLVHHGLRASR